MPKHYIHTTFRCGHHEISIVRPENKTVWSKIKNLTRINRRTSSSLCSTCESNKPRNEHPARGTSPSIARIARAGHDTAIKAFDITRFYWDELATRTSSRNDDRSHECLSKISQGKRTREKINKFWADTHTSHLENIPSGVLDVSKPGPDTCRLCRVVMRSLMEPQYQIDQPSGLLRRYKRSKVPQVPEELIESLQRTQRRRRRRAFSRHMSLIIEEAEAADDVSYELPTVPDSGHLSSYLWQPSQGATGEGNSTNDNSPNPTLGRWQKPPLSGATSSNVAPTDDSDSTRPQIPRRNSSLNIAQFLLSEHSLRQPRTRAPPPRLNPDSLEGRAAIQRIRKHLNLPNATPLQILSIRALPKKLCKKKDLRQLKKDVLSVAWRQEDMDAANGANATQPHGAVVTPGYPRRS